VACPRLDYREFRGHIADRLSGKFSRTCDAPQQMQRH
jgi:hypothetical protein